MAARRTSVNVHRRLDAEVHVNAAAPRRLRVADEAQFVEHRLEPFHGGSTRLVEPGAGLRVEVDAQLVGMIDVGSARMPRMERHRAQLGRPGDRREMGHLQCVGGAGRSGTSPRTVSS